MLFYTLIISMMGWITAELSAPLHSSHAHAEKYQQLYASLAQQEMARTGIPASIKLGQGMLETQYGQSRLSTEARNHYGLKCKDYWIGAELYVVDDDRDASGQLVPSCFRAYGSVADSYRDHSDFLRYQPAYRSLFQSGSKDYKEWARGLARCGYATDPRYAEKLIRIIERYDLTRYDHQSYERHAMKTTTHPVNSPTRPPAPYRLPQNYQRGGYLPNK